VREWQKDKKWSDRFLDEIKRILGHYLIGEPPQEEDAERNTDLVVLKMEAVRIGCRVRRYWTKGGKPTSFLDKYADEFTIRSGRPTGIKTELTKIIEGWGDYFLYGFADEEETQLAAWILGDLKAFRLWHSQQICRNSGVVPGVKQNNVDGSSCFRAYKIQDLPPEFIVGRQKKAAYTEVEHY